MVICYGMALKKLGMLGVRVRKMKILTVKVERVTLIGKGRYNLTPFMYKVEQFYLADFYFGGSCLRLWLSCTCVNKELKWDKVLHL